MPVPSFPPADAEIFTATCEEQVGVRSKNIPAGAAREGQARRTAEEGMVGDSTEEGEGGEGQGEREEGKSASAKALCIPLKQPKLEEDARCFACGLPANCSILWGRSY